MVMHVEVCQESSFFSVEDSINVILVEPDDRDESFELQEFSSLARDTSQTSRESTDNTRMNVQTSIMDDHDEDDDEDDDGSVLFQELQETNPHRLQEDAEDVSLLGRFSPDRFFDSLCSVKVHRSSRPCLSSLPQNCMASPCPPKVEDEDIKEFPTTPNSERLQVESDVWNLLGCTSPPTGMELETIWNLTTTTNAASQTPSAPSRRQRPSRASLKHRMQRIQRLQQDRWAGATRHGVTLSKHHTTCPRSISMDQLDSKDYSTWKDPATLDLSSTSLGIWLNRKDSKRQPRDDHQSQDGYDSDPEMNNRRGVDPKQNLPTSAETKMATIIHDSENPDFLIYLAVQVSGRMRTMCTK